MSSEHDTSAHKSHGNARCTWAQLKCMTPAPHSVSERLVLRRDIFGGLETWRLVGGVGDKAIFEREGGH